jgi:hypothetical protein
MKHRSRPIGRDSSATLEPHFLIGRRVYGLYVNAYFKRSVKVFSCDIVNNLEIDNALWNLEVYV